GAISGLVVRRQPEVIRRYFALPYELCLVKDLETKHYVGLRIALEAKVTISLLPNPSSLIVLAEKLTQHAEELIEDVRRGRLSSKYQLAPEVKRAVERRISANPRRADELASLLRNEGQLLPYQVWPELVLLSCWKGGTMPLYLAKLPRYFGNIPVRDLGFMASEGRIATPIVNSGAAGVLNVTSHFFEFVPEEEMDSSSPRIVTAGELESNRQYYVLLTTSAGLYRYNLNDLVRVVDFYYETPVLQFVRKGQGMSSITGEKLAESQVTAALMSAVERSGFEPVHFTTCVLWGEPPRYQLFVEALETTSDDLLRGFLHHMEAGLREENVEYVAKRDSERLGDPVLRLVAPGTYDAYRARRAAQGAAEAQIKVPHLSPDMNFGKEFVVAREIAS
ncbi:MAG: GH3 auxin-responsive promoter family protein, partial [Chloroflexi bacterium]|nr:GH3 auxin-responsive promoter family protein [Chloroflexota bacterium]